MYNLTSLYQRRAEHVLVFMYKMGKCNIADLELLRSKNKVKFKCALTNIVIHIYDQLCNIEYYQHVL